jgi:hypothetical protein
MAPSRVRALLCLGLWFVVWGATFQKLHTSIHTRRNTPQSHLRRRGVTSEICRGRTAGALQKEKARGVATMVKFGETIEEGKRPEWVDGYVDYSGLKKLLEAMDTAGTIRECVPRLRLLP